MSISVDLLVKYYGSQKVLNDVSFSIERGGVQGFLGPNGAGKSTLMKILSGSITAASGKAYVCGIDVEEHSMEARRLIGYLPEHNPLYLDMYVREYLQMVASIYKLCNARQAAETAIERTGLGPECHKLIGQLSKGYRQRVGLAQTLLHEPEVLILDEPTTGLDPNQIVQIRKLIVEMGKEKTVLLSSHIMQEVEAICERVIILDKGTIVANDTTASLKMQAAGGAFTIELLEDCAIGLLTQLPFVGSAQQVSTNTFTVQATTPNADIRPELFRWAVQQNLTIITMNRHEWHLEDVFRKVTSC